MCWRFQAGSILGLIVLVSDIQNIGCMWATLLTFQRSLLASSGVGKASADTKICCGFFRTGFRPSSHWRQCSGSLLWQPGSKSINNCCGGRGWRLSSGEEDPDRLSRLLAFPLYRRCEYFILFSFPKLFRENVIVYWKSLECMYILILIVGASVSCTALLFLFYVLYRSCFLLCLLSLFWNEREQACDLGRQHTIVFRFVELTHCWLLK